MKTFTFRLLLKAHPTDLQTKWREGNVDEGGINTRIKSPNRKFYSTSEMNLFSNDWVNVGEDIISANLVNTRLLFSRYKSSSIYMHRSTIQTLVLYVKQANGSRWTCGPTGCQDVDFFQFMVISETCISRSKFYPKITQLLEKELHPSSSLRPLQLKFTRQA